MNVPAFLSLVSFLYSTLWWHVFKVGVNPTCPSYALSEVVGYYKLFESIGGVHVGV